MEVSKNSKYFSVSELMKVGVTKLYEEEDRIFTCNNCGLTWMVSLKEDGMLPDNYWTCPKECNTPADTTIRNFRLPVAVSGDGPAVSGDGPS